MTVIRSRVGEREERADWNGKLRRLTVREKVRTPRGVGIVVSVGPDDAVRVARRWDPEHGFDGVETFHVREVEVL